MFILQNTWRHNHVGLRRLGRCAWFACPRNRKTVAAHPDRRQKDRHHSLLYTVSISGTGSWTRGIWETTDGGLTWTRVVRCLDQRGLSTAHYFNGKFTPVNATTYLWAGGDNALGLWRLTDRMRTRRQVTGTDDQGLAIRPLATSCRSASAKRRPARHTRYYCSRSAIVRSRRRTPLALSSILATG